jgi:hypothetical protein
MSTRWRPPRSSSGAYDDLPHPGSAAVATRELADTGSTVEVGCDGDVLRLALNRPERRNAVTARLRDELWAAFQVAFADDSIERVVLTGRGPSACSVGELAEFGARTDPAAAHLIRLVGSPARPLHRGRSARGRGPRAHAPRGHRDGLLRRARPRRRRHHKVVASVPGEDVSESREHPGQRSLGEALDVVAVHDPAVVGDGPVLVAGCRAVQHGSASANVTGGSGGGVAPTTKSS